MDEYMKPFYKNIENFILHPKFVFQDFKYQDEVIYNNVPLSRDHFNKFIDKNELNNNSYRCDNFKNIHKGKHILFTGCSVTYGSGLLMEEVWAKKTYNKINEENNCSGYFNLAIGGTSIPHQIFDIFKYCRSYGNPDYIFFNMPDKFRFYAISKNNAEIVDSMYGFESLKLMNLISYQYYFMLDQYCKTNNIQLFTFSWSYPEQIFEGKKIKLKNNNYIDNKFKMFDSYYEINVDELMDYVFEYSNKNKNDKYALLARDNDHFGTAYHEYWSNFIYSRYVLKNNEINI